MVEEKIKQIEKEIVETKVSEDNVVNSKNKVKIKNSELVEPIIQKNEKVVNKKHEGVGEQFHEIASKNRVGLGVRDGKIMEGGVKINEKKQNKQTTKSKVSQKKLKSVAELSKLAKEKKTILIASIKNLPASQFQEICKSLRGKAIVKVPKKSITIRALEHYKEIEDLKQRIDSDVAILFSDLDAFELARELIENKSRVKGRIGQEAPEDIEVPEGPTDLIPGPAVSELGALGIKISIEGGKINIKEPKKIVRKGEKISEGAAGLMNKLDIKPFLVGFEPIAAFDTKENKIYLNINIDKEGILNELKDSFGRALPFAVEIGYICEDSIKFMIGKAGMQEKALEKIAEAGASEDNKVDNEKIEIKGETNVSEEKVEPNVEENKDNNESNTEPIGEANAQQENKVEEEKQ